MRKFSDRLCEVIFNSSSMKQEVELDKELEWVKYRWYKWDAIRIMRHLRAYGVTENISKEIARIISEQHGEQVTEQMCSDIANWLRNLPPGSLKWGKLM